MFKNIKQLYALAVCFVCIIILMVSLGTTIHDVIHHMNPEYYQRHSLERYQSNENFLDGVHDTKKRKEYEKLSTEKLAEMRVQQREEFLINAKGQLFWILLDKLPWTITALLFFIPHWILYRRSVKEQ